MLLTHELLHQWTKISDIARKHHRSESCSSPFWRDYTFWLQTYSQQVSVEWISQSISKAVYSCIMLKEGQNYETSGQLLLSRFLKQQSCDFGTERSVPSDLSYLSEGSIWTNNYSKTWLCCTQCLRICNQCLGALILASMLVIFWQNPSEMV